MKQLRILIYFFCLISVFFSCNNKKKEKEEERKKALQNADIMPSDKLADVLTDVYLAEGAMCLKEIHADNPGFYANKYFKYVFDKHNVSSEQFLTSYKYYAADADEMLKIIEMVLNNLTQQQGMIEGKPAVSESDKKENK
ncbi:MAG TPA: DUF4296 domain-containing protein [Bacteroidales bacterium]|nr:DUF4296 domain-containing protein [Bacteroidales bacterium]HPS16514.1 DUF4296 domain-containing protein [Bacteroidales bacterium]